MAVRIVRRVDNEGKAWVDDGNGGEVPFQMVMNSAGALGLRSITEEEAHQSGIDQLGPSAPLPPPAPERSAPIKPSDHFNVSSLDQ